MNGPIRVMDIMKPPDNYPTVSSWHSVRQAREITNSFYHHNPGASRPGERMTLVVDEENQLAGLINMESASLSPHRKIEDIMMPADKISIKSTDTAGKAFSILYENNVGTLPVLNIFRQIIGIVQAGDVFHALGLRSSFLKLAFTGYDYQRYGLFDDYYIDFLEEMEKKNGAPQGTL